MDSKFLLVLGFCLSLTNGNEVKCPSSNYLKNCSCDMQTIAIVCEQVMEVPNFEDFYGYNFTSITFRDTNIRKVPLSNAVTSKLILINNHNLEDFDSIDSFKPKSLILINNKHFTQVSLGNLLKTYEYSKELHELVIENHLGISNLEYTFGNFINLQSITLKNNGIKKIGSSLFDELDHLESLDLSYNNIDSFNQDSFTFSSVPNDGLIIDLRNNKIDQHALKNLNVPEDQGNGPIVVVLSNNKITELSEIPFKNLCKWRVNVFLAGNNLTCNYHEVQWLFREPDCKQYLRNAYCSNYDKEISNMSENDFNETSKVTTIQVSSTEQPKITVNFTQTEAFLTRSIESSTTTNPLAPRRVQFGITKSNFKSTQQEKTHLWICVADSNNNINGLSHCATCGIAKYNLNHAQWDDCTALHKWELVTRDNNLSFRLCGEKENDDPLKKAFDVGFISLKKYFNSIDEKNQPATINMKNGNKYYETLSTTITLTT